jgi:Ca2+-binding RTX toxin-like protein
VLINLAGQVTADGVNTDTLLSIENAIGSALNDTIIGNAGVNVLEGGRGADTIDGQAGDDLFVYHAVFGKDDVSAFAGGSEDSPLRIRGFARRVSSRSCLRFRPISRTLPLGGGGPAPLGP